MELKVWVEGIQRIVCGVTEKTTCQDVVYALAHATGKTGRFTLIERWRNNERLLAPQEHPLKVLMKWGEYSNDVQFILQRTSLGSSEQPSPDSSKILQDLPSPGGGNKERSSQKDLKKSLTFSGSHVNNDSPFKGKNNVGIVKGVPQAQRKEEEQLHYYVGQENGKIHDYIPSDRIEVVANVRCYGNAPNVDKHNAYNASITPTSPSQIRGWPAPHESDSYDSDRPNRTEPPKGHERHMRSPPPGEGVLRSPLGDGVLRSPPGDVVLRSPSGDVVLRSPPGDVVLRSPSTDGVLRSPPGDNIVRSPTGENALHHRPQLPPYRDPPPPGKPPPYRDPPPPPQRLFKVSSPTISSSDRDTDTATPSSLTQSPANSSHSHTPTNMGHGHTPTSLNHGHTPPSLGHTQTHGSKSPKAKRNLLKEYKPSGGIEIDNEDRQRELLKIISAQRDRLSSQQNEISKLDAEICYWENKGRDHQRQLEQIAQDLRRLDMQGARNEQEVRELQEYEEKSEVLRSQERLLQSEILHVQGKLTSCENQLQQCRGRMRSLSEELAEEQRRMTEQEEEQREKDNLERQLAQRQREYQGILKEKEQLNGESTDLEQELNEKKEQLELLVEELKQANLQSLQITPTEDIRALLEDVCSVSGPGHSKSSRRLVSNPRQLENAVPTSKNPHGVWV